MIGVTNKYVCDRLNMFYFIFVIFCMLFNQTLKEEKLHSNSNELLRNL